MYPEFKKNRDGIERAIDLYQRNLDVLKGKITPEDLEALNTDLDTLRQIQIKWQEHEIRLALCSPPSPRFPLPLDWVKDKQACYDTKMDMEKILDHYPDSMWKS